MASSSQEPQTGGLSARLRALRREHPTLAVLTEIIQLDERRVTFRATVQIDGEARAQGHAAQGVDPAGEFVAAAERLAVEQALLLGGFGSPEEATATPDDRAASHTPALLADTATPMGMSSPPEASPMPPTPRRGRRLDQPTASQPSVVEIESHESVLAAEVPGVDSDLAAVPALAPPPAADDVALADLPHSPSTPLIATATSVSLDAPVEPSPTPHRKRDRRAERERARMRQSAAEQGAIPEDDPDQTSQVDVIATGAAEGLPVQEEAQQVVPEQLPMPTEEAPPVAIESLPSDGPSVETKPEVAELPPPPPRRRAASRTVVAQQAAPVPNEQTTQDAVRADWRAGRPIPAWWPPDRSAVEKPLTRTQVERLREVAIGEEITPAQLDSFSTMIFGSVVAKLNQAQGAILEERLNPTYPSPLQELSARRVLHPIAVGDTVTIPEGQSAFIRWRDVPPVEEAPPVPSWRTGGAKGSRNRRR